MTRPSSPFAARGLDLLSALRQKAWAGPVAAALFALILSIWTFDLKIGLSGDNAEFIILARSLASGQGLSYIHLPDPTAATKFPPVFPLMLAPIAFLFDGAASVEMDTAGAEIVVMKWLVVLTFAASAAFLYLLTRDRLGETIAAATTLLAVSNPLTVSYAHQVMSEIPYVMWSLLAVWLLGRGIERPTWRGNYWLWSGIAAMLAAYYTRSVGICLIAAVILHLFSRRDWRRGLIVGGICFCAMLPWAVRNSMLGGSVYYKLLFMVNPYRPHLGYLNATGMYHRITGTLGLYVEEFLPEALLPASYLSMSSLWWAAVVVSVLAVGSVAHCLIRRKHLLILIYSALAIGTLTIWPWSGPRFVLPLLPFLWFLGVNAFAEGLSWLRDRGHAWVSILGVGALVSVLALNLVGLNDVAQRSAKGYEPKWRNYLTVGLWLRTETPQDAIVTSRKALWMHIVSGRRTVTFAFEEPVALLADLDRQGVTYAVVDKLGPPQTAEFLVPAISSAIERFELVCQVTEPETWVVKFVDGDPPSEPAD